ncbi:MAG: 3-isopropylmalate dehydratase large subunit [Deltaproteobacteria bacterium]|nr:3-isopropylmalate dehydratase large subunit [Deltaproteobacteria bacterium]MBW2308825.1 3-isopropylmalate dehydratase large subunit [Deltaproteobacteria bacterium]
MAGKTIAEKILSIKSGTEAEAGRVAVATIDVLMGNDTKMPSALSVLRSMDWKGHMHTERLVIVVDHFVPPAEERRSNEQMAMREFARKHDIPFYDAGAGIAHQVLMEKGYVLPGTIVLGTDSHCTTYGALNAFGTGISSTELVGALINGYIWLKVPETIKVELKGSLPAGVYAKDVILEIIGLIGLTGPAEYRAIEFTGAGLQSLELEERFTLCNMAVEMGVKVGLMEADDKAINWLRGRARGPFEPVAPDPDAAYKAVYQLDLGSMVPLVAAHPSIDNLKPASELGAISIHQAFIGTCCNGRLSDLRAASQILKGREIHPDVRLYVGPASREVYLAALKEGIVESLSRAGAIILPPGCGPCAGLTGSSIPASGQRMISTSNRNFPGRAGAEGVEVYLASPATVTASAIRGAITDPREL